jgi:aminopeptidase N
MFTKRKPAFFFILCLGCLAVSGFNHVTGNNPVKSESAKDYNENYDVGFYFLNLNISDSSNYIRGCASVYLNLLDPSSRQVILDFANLLVSDSVRVNDWPANFGHSNNRLTVDLPQDLSGSRLKVDVFYHGLGKIAGNVSGIYNKYSSLWDKRITWTLSESFSAMNWFPCKQSLIDKADSAYIFLSTDKKLKAGSNGILTASVALPDNRIRYEWKCRYPIDYYLISFAVSDYRDYSFYARRENGSDSILVQNYIYNNDTFFEQNKGSIDKTSELINLYSDLFGVYPFHSEKYGHCVAPSGGGMEHQTMTTLVNFSYLLVAHELSHQWFGDYVTCKTWQDIWINEGFASYAEYLANQYLVSQSDADSWMARTQEYVKSLPGGSVYLPEASSQDEERIFDYRLTYGKGAAIIHMIRQEVGNDELFFSILREFLHRYKNSNASGMDFRNLLGEMTGRNFDSFFDQWYYGEGFPILAVNWYHRHDTLYIQSLETASSSTPFFNVLVEYRVTVNNRDTVVSYHQDSSYNSWHIYLPGEVTGLQVDPRHWLLMNVAGISQIASVKSASRFALVPNPARDKITLHFAEPVYDYIIYLTDASGKILYTEQSKSQRKTITIDTLPKGMYFVVVNEKNMIYPVKFIKN